MHKRKCRYLSYLQKVSKADIKVTKQNSKKAQQKQNFESQSIAWCTKQNEKSTPFSKKVHFFSGSLSSKI